MELRQLEYFTTVADELGFARAAERLHVVQPAVSQQIRRLERELGVQLFDRTSRRVRLTAAGERLVPAARAVLAGAERMRQQAGELANGGRLRLGTSQGLGSRLPQVLAELADREPATSVELVSRPVGERIAMVRAGQLDAAFLRTRRPVRDLELIPLWEEPLVAALPARHPLAAGATVSLLDLRDLPLRLAPRQENPAFHELVVGACADAGFEPVLGPVFTNAQDTLADLSVGAPGWTPLYAAGAQGLAPAGVAILPLTGVRTRTCLAVLPGVGGVAIRGLLDACAAVA